MNFFQVKTQVGIEPEILFRIAGYPVSNTMMSGMLITIILAIICLIAVTTFKKEGKPGKFQVVVESTVEALINFTSQISGSREIALKILPITGGVFIYIGIANIILILLPFLTGLNINGVSLFRSHTGDFNTTIGISLAVIIGANMSNIASTNIFAYLGKFIRVKGLIEGFKKGPSGIFMGVVDFLLGLLDIISEFAKVISLSLRLFGNMFAGDILNAILMSSLAVVAPAILIVYSLFTGFIQAIVFGALTTSHFAASVVSNTESEEESV